VMLAARITLPHFSVSSAMSLPRSRRRRRARNKLWRTCNEQQNTSICNGQSDRAANKLSAGPKRSGVAQLYDADGK
jgi:hypothetical protein